MKVNEGYLFYSACSDKFLTYDEDKKKANIFIHQANTGYTNQVWILTQTNTRPLVDGVYNIHSAIDTNPIRRMLPHRWPFLMVDKVLEITDRVVVGIKNVSGNETFFMGHQY